MSIRERSPIFHLETAMAGCAFNIAPEHNSELVKVRDARKVILEVTDETSFAFRVDTENGNVTIPVAAVEYLWSCAYLFPVAYKEYTKAQRAGCLRLNLRDSARFVKAEALWSWARNNMMKSAIAQWPSELPSPEDAGDEDNQAFQ